MTTNRTPAEHAELNQTAGSAPPRPSDLLSALAGLADAVRAGEPGAIAAALEVADQARAAAPGGAA